jgi:hypothetical protein
MSNDLFVSLVALLGAAIQETVHWYTLRTKLTQSEHRRTLRSLPYWGATLAMALLSAAGTWAWFHGEAQPARTYLLVGAAFPLILKKAIGALVSDGRVGFGNKAQDASWIRSYLA